MYIGVDIGGTKCAVTWADQSGNIRKKIRFATTSKEETLYRIRQAIAEMGAAEAIGISCGGPLDAAHGIILSPPNLPTWDHVEIVSMLQTEFGIKAYLQNDANACALAEWRFGAGKGSSNMVFLTFGTGLGAGLILNGRLYQGTNGNAGEIGHIRLAENGPVGFGKRGSFEGFCSGGGLAQQGKILATELFQCGLQPSFCPSLQALDRITAKSIAAAADAGNDDALSIYRSCGHELGRGLSILVDLLNPERIVIGSIYTRSEALLKEEMLAVMQKECLAESLAVCRVLPAALGEQIGDIAAISVAMQGKEEEA